MKSLNNHIETRHWGVYANNCQGDHVIENNTFDKYTTNGDWLIYVTNAASVTVKWQRVRGAWRQRFLLQQHECDGGAELDCDAPVAGWS